MVLVMVLVLWLAASAVVMGLCVAAARGDAKQSAALRRRTDGAGRAAALRQAA